VPIRYETWRLTHGIGAGLVAVLGTHHTLSAGTYSAAPALAAFWLGLSAIALLSLTHVYLVRPLHKRRRPWRVVMVEAAADRIWRVAIEPDGHRPATFVAGQFAWLNLGHSPFSLTEHPSRSRQRRCRCRVWSSSSRRAATSRGPWVRSPLGRWRIWTDRTATSPSRDETALDTDTARSS
jgi:predicted ferric reductase